MILAAVLYWLGAILMFVATEHMVPDEPSLPWRYVAALLWPVVVIMALGMLAHRAGSLIGRMDGRASGGYQPRRAPAPKHPPRRR